MSSDWIAPLMILLWATIMFIPALFSLRRLERDRKEEELDFYRQIYGPAGKPAKPSTAEPQSPKQSAE